MDCGRSPSTSRTRRRWRLLREFGVDYCQGFEVGKPARRGANRRTLSRRRTRRLGGPRAVQPSTPSSSSRRALGRQAAAVAAERAARCAARGGRGRSRGSGWRRARCRPRGRRAGCRRRSPSPRSCGSRRRGSRAGPRARARTKPALSRQSSVEVEACRRSREVLRRAGGAAGSRRLGSSTIRGPIATASCSSIASRSSPDQPTRTSPAVGRRKQQLADRRLGDRPGDLDKTLALGG